MLAVYGGADNLLMRFEYADDRLPVFMTAGGVTYYLAYDQVGSLRLVADSVGNVIKSVEYDSFGNILSDSNPTFAMPFGFAGGLHDRDTGLVRFGYRDYDPDVGRWTAKDPIFFAGGDTDLYGYVLNNPINAVDPWGLVDIFIGVEGDLVGIVGAEGGAGIVIDTDNWRDSGVYGTIGPAVGANVGIGVGAGIVKEVEGWSYGLDANILTVSPTVIGDNNGFNGLGVSGGLGLGLSASATYTGSLTFNDVQRFADWMIEEILRQILGSDPCK